MIIPAVIQTGGRSHIVWWSISFRKLAAARLSSGDQLNTHFSLLCTTADALTCTDAVFKAIPAYIANLRSLTATLVHRLCCHGDGCTQGRRATALPHLRFLVRLHFSLSRSTLCVFSLSNAAFHDLFQLLSLLWNKTEIYKMFVLLCTFTVDFWLYYTLHNILKITGDRPKWSPLLEHSPVKLVVLLDFYSKIIENKTSWKYCMVWETQLS